MFFNFVRKLVLVFFFQLQLSSLKNLVFQILFQLIVQVNRTDGAGVPDGSNDGKEENGAQVIKKQPVGHEISSVQDDGRKHVKEEDLRSER